MVTNDPLGDACSRRRRPGGRSGRPAARQSTALERGAVEQLEVGCRRRPSSTARAARRRGRRSSSPAAAGRPSRRTARSTQHEVDDGEQQARAAAERRDRRCAELRVADRRRDRPSSGDQRRGRASGSAGTARCVTRLCRFLAASAAAQLARAPSRRAGCRARRMRGISKLGEPSSPTPSRTGPSIGTITLVASRQFVARPALRRVGDRVAEEVVRADRAPATPGTRCSSSRR